MPADPAAVVPLALAVIRVESGSVTWASNCRPSRNENATLYRPTVAVTESPTLASSETEVCALPSLTTHETLSGALLLHALSNDANARHASNAGFVSPPR